MEKQATLKKAKGRMSCRLLSLLITGDVAWPEKRR
jgi:hypothetical protein